MKKNNIELRLGTCIISLYLIWAVVWTVARFFFKIDIPLSLDQELLSPFTTYKNSIWLLGSDIYGRSLFKVLSTGLVYSLIISALVSSFSLFIGIVIGFLASETKGFVEYLLKLLINAFFIFPTILLAILVMAWIGPSVFGLVAALILAGWPSYARIAYAEAKRVKAMPFVESAISIGVGKIYLLFKVMLPSMAPVLLVHFVMGLSGVILSEAILSFLGLGGSEYSWGEQFAIAKNVLLEAPHISIILSILFGGLLVSLNLIGDGLRDKFDPLKDSRGKND